MSIRAFIVALSAAVILGCGGKAPQKEQAAAPLKDSTQQSVAAPPMQPAAKPENQGAPTRVASDSPIPPADAQWTLFCEVIAGPAHVERAARMKQQLIATTGWKDWYLVHEEASSTLYFGYYKVISDPANKKQTERARRDREKLINLVDADGSHPFRGAFFMRITSPDPVAPPEWNLANAPEDKYWSLQIAAYMDNPDRKQAAVDAVTEARKQGIEAYYFHGEVASVVTIGAWPRNAIKEQESDRAETYDPDQPVLVTDGTVPSGSLQNVRTKDGKKVKAMSPRVEIDDPTLAAARAQFPSHAINGEEIVRTGRDPVTGAVKQAADQSFMVVIPRKATMNAGDAPLLERAANTARQRPQQPTGPRLRQLE